LVNGSFNLFQSLKLLVSHRETFSFTIWN